jgi:hypothetical protein
VVASMGIDKVESLPPTFAKDGLIERVGGELFLVGKQGSGRCGFGCTLFVFSHAGTTFPCWLACPADLPHT